MGLGPVELDENSHSGINFFDSNGHGSCCLDRGNYTVSGWSSSRSSVIELNYTTGILLRIRMRYTTTVLFMKRLLSQGRWWKIQDLSGGKHGMKMITSGRSF